MKKPALIILGIWLTTLSYPLLQCQWLSGYDPEFQYFIGSLVFTGAISMMLYGFGILRNRTK
jgi:hypothetical protein